MPKSRKSRLPRADSKEQAVIAMVHADKVINPPDDMDLTKDQLRIFREVIAEFAKIDWSDHTIRLAAILSRTIGEVIGLQDDLMDEGYTGTTARGGPCLNPKVSALNMMSTSVLSMRRSLALHAIAGKNAGDVGKRRGINKGNEADAPEDDENLLARPAA